MLGLGGGLERGRATPEARSLQLRCTRSRKGARLQLRCTRPKGAACPTLQALQFLGFAWVWLYVHWIYVWTSFMVGWAARAQQVLAPARLLACTSAPRNIVD